MNIFNFLHSFFGRLRSNARQDPARDWIAMLIVALVALIGIVVWNAWAFDSASRGGVIGASPVTPAPVLNRTALDGIQNIFVTRAAEESKYVTGTYKYVDPSQ